MCKREVKKLLGRQANSHFQDDPIPTGRVSSALSGLHRPCHRNEASGETERGQSGLRAKEGGWEWHKSTCFTVDKFSEHQSKRRKSKPLTRASWETESSPKQGSASVQLQVGLSSLPILK